MRRLSRPRHSRRLTRLAGWTALVGALVACALGLKLTRTQYLSVSAVILDIEKRSADNLRPEIERRLRLEEERILRAIEERVAAPERLADLAAVEPMAAAPFLLDADATLVSPLQGAPLPDPGELDSPPEVEQALRVFWSGAAPEEKARALDAVYGREALDLRSRVRARALSLGLQARHGAAAAAAAGYEELLERLPPGDAGSGPPSWLQLATAHCECLLLAGQPRAAAEVATRALATLGAGVSSRRASLADERIFLRRARDVFLRAQAPPPSSLLEVEARLHEREAALDVLESLRGAILAGAGAGPDRDGEPQLFHEERATPAGKRSLLAVWRSLPGEAAGAPGRVCGFLVNTERLEEAVAAAARQAAPELQLSARAVPRPTGDGFVDLTGLGGERSFVRLGLERDVWDERLGQARRPFQLAALLILALGAALACGFAVFFRGVRAEMELSRLKTEFVANVSHELKTPLALIRLFGETLLLDRVADPDQKRRYYQIITRESERLSHLISNVLSFASIEAGRKSYELRPTDLSRVARETFESYLPHLREWGFEHRLEAPESLHPVPADPDAVAQALINLLDNAVKYSKDHREIVMRVEETPGDVRLSVADRGIGIAAHDQERVFEDHYRTREARALGTRGSGLGLSLVQHILRAHGGSVELRSEAGQGSVFTLVFPRQAQADTTQET